LRTTADIWAIVGRRVVVHWAHPASCPCVSCHVDDRRWKDRRLDIEEQHEEKHSGRYLCLKGCCLSFLRGAAVAHAVFVSVPIFISDSDCLVQLDKSQRDDSLARMRAMSRFV
jgi:hypothetical protein